MSISRVSVAAAATAATLYFGLCLSASSQQIMAQEKKPTGQTVTASASASATAKPAPVRSSTHVYLLRGLMNVFSLGMDDLAAKLQARGIGTTVANHAEWQTLSDEIAAKYKAGNRGAIVLIGHSFGADNVMLMGDYLGKKGVPVALIVPIDASGPLPATANVARVLNITQRDFAKMTRGPGFHGDLTNMDLSKDPNIGHLNIDKSPRLHAMIIGRIMALGGGGGTKAASPADGAPAAPAAPAPHGQNAVPSTSGSAASAAPTTTAAAPAPAQVRPVAKKDAPI